MKVLIIAICAMGFGFVAFAQTSAPVAATSPDASAASPNVAPATSTTDPDNTRYLKDPNLLAGCGAQLNAFENKPCDIIFIGGTNTAGWRAAGSAVWAKTYEPRHALNFGVIMDTTQNVLWRLNNMDIQNLKPKVAVILIGGSNLDNTAHQIADGIKAVLANTQAAFPGVKIILVSLLPNETDPDKVKQVNSIIRSFADDSSNYFLDLASLMTPAASDGANPSSGASFKGLSRDGVSLSPAGYQMWADAMEPTLTKLLAEH
jgi:beta-glucosidase